MIQNLKKLKLHELRPASAIFFIPRDATFSIQVTTGHIIVLAFSFQPCSVLVPFCQANFTFKSLTIEALYLFTDWSTCAHTNIKYRHDSAIHGVQKHIAFVFQSIGKVLIKMVEYNNQVNRINYSIEMFRPNQYHMVFIFYFSAITIHTQ